MDMYDKFAAALIGYDVLAQLHNLKAYYMAWDRLEKFLGRPLTDEEAINLENDFEWSDRFPWLHIVRGDRTKPSEILEELEQMTEKYRSDKRIRMARDIKRIVDEGKNRGIR